MLAKGNLGYVRHYERHFDEVHVAYLRGHSPRSQALGDTRFVSLGGAVGGDVADVLLAPFRLYRFARRVRPTSYLTADIIFSWWTSLLVRILSRARIVLMPVCMPESIYASTNRSLHGLPIWLERRLRTLSFMSAASIIAPVNAEALIAWLKDDAVAARKTRITAAIVDEFPPEEFYASAGNGGPASAPGPVPELLYVGRLHPEKKAHDLIEMMGILRQRGVDVRLHLVGDGIDRARMEARAEELRVAERVVFHGAMPNRAIVPLYLSATLFVSTVTGTALREAGLLGTPIVAYAIDWVAGLLRDGETGLLVRPGDPVDLADKVARALEDPVLRRRMGEAFHTEAHARWPLANIARGLRDAFAEDDGETA